MTPTKVSKGYHQLYPGWIVRDDDEAEAVRFYKSEGACFSGWIVRATNGLQPSDPIATKTEAIAALLRWER